jgi:hypothetical protein
MNLQDTLNTHKKVKSITFPSCNKCSINKPKSEHFQTRSYNQNICGNAVMRPMMKMNLDIIHIHIVLI